jgi:hypothetical protein
MLSARNQQVVLERAAGQTITQIGDRHSISHQMVSKIVAEADDLLDRMVADLATGASIKPPQMRTAEISTGSSPMSASASGDMPASGGCSTTMISIVGGTA